MMSSSSVIVDKIHSTVRIDSPTHVINLSEQVFKVEMSPFEWSHNLICVAHSDEIIIGTVKFQEEDEEMEDEIEFEVIKSFKIEKRVHSLAWCPETSLNIIPKSIIFACGTANHIHIYSTNMADKTQMQELKGHSSYVNSLAYEPSGDLLASTSDDLTCRIWAVKEGSACVTVFVLKSPGVSVCWHNADPGKLLVAEKSGTVRLYNVERQQAILSLDTSLVPLTAADWSPVNCFQVAALASGHIVIWDITRSSRPVDVRMVHPNGGSLLRYSQQSEYHIATVGQPDNSLKVTNVNMKHPVCNATMTLAGGVTWTYRLPYVCVGRDRSICFWKVSTK
ncbi:nucleoporin Nup37 [Macrosteles quadrilineatus]|uniref:nucleoporin Nup37 n=1 Tax=Macrosteles quadrilineatus TaxID=74068 RepID=UPI0023E1337D|nr:nucleoporin Nup37 [Macrosteles quadrilineatus]